MGKGIGRRQSQTVKIKAKEYIMEKRGVRISEFWQTSMRPKKVKNPIPASLLSIRLSLCPCARHKYELTKIPSFGRLFRFYTDGCSCERATVNPLFYYYYKMNYIIPRGKKERRKEWQGKIMKENQGLHVLVDASIPRQISLHGAQQTATLFWERNRFSYFAFFFFFDWRWSHNFGIKY